MAHSPWMETSARIRLLYLCSTTATTHSGIFKGGKSDRSVNQAEGYGENWDLPYKFLVAAILRDPEQSLDLTMPDWSYNCDSVACWHLAGAKRLLKVDLSMLV